MKYFRIIYEPHGRHNTEWTVKAYENKNELNKSFNMGMIINVEEITKEEYDEDKDEYELI